MARRKRKYKTRMEMAQDIETKDNEDLINTKKINFYTYRKDIVHTQGMRRNILNKTRNPWQMKVRNSIQKIVNTKFDEENADTNLKREEFLEVAKDEITKVLNSNNKEITDILNKSNVCFTSRVSMIKQFFWEAYHHWVKEVQASQYSIDYNSPSLP